MEATRRKGRPIGRQSCGDCAGAGGEQMIGRRAKTFVDLFAINDQAPQAGNIMLLGELEQRVVPRARWLEIGAPLKQLVPVLVDHGEIEAAGRMENSMLSAAGERRAVAGGAARRGAPVGRPTTAGWV